MIDNLMKHILGSSPSAVEQLLVNASLERTTCRHGEDHKGNNNQNTSTYMLYPNTLNLVIK